RGHVRTLAPPESLGPVPPLRPEAPFPASVPLSDHGGRAAGYIGLCGSYPHPNPPTQLKKILCNRLQRLDPCKRQAILLKSSLLFLAYRFAPRKLPSRRPSSHWSRFANNLFASSCDNLGLRE